MNTIQTLLIYDCANFGQTNSEREVARTHNIKINEIKKEGVCRLYEVCASNKHSASAKNANYFMEEKSLSIVRIFCGESVSFYPFFFYFVNPFSVRCNN